MTHIISWTDTSNCHVFQEKLLVFWRGYQVYHEHMGHEQHKGNDEQIAMVRLKNTIKLFSTGTYDGQQPDRLKASPSCCKPQ